MKNRIIRLCIMSVCSLVTAHALSAEILYGININNDYLYEFNVQTGLATSIGSPENGMFAFGLAEYDGELYTYDQTAHVIHRLSRTSGQVAETIDLGIVARSEGALAIRDDGTGILVDAGGKLFEFDLINQTAAQILGGNYPGNIDGLAFDSSGTLYGYSSMGDFFTLDTTTGNTTNIGILDATAGFVGGLAFMQGDILVASLLDGFYQIDLESGQTTLLFESGSSAFISGIAFVQVPIPSSAVLMVSALLGLRFFRSVQHRRRFQ